MNSNAQPRTQQCPYCHVLLINQPRSLTNHLPKCKRHPSKGHAVLTQEIRESATASLQAQGSQRFDRLSLYKRRRLHVSVDSDPDLLSATVSASTSASILASIPASISAVPQSDISSSLQEGDQDNSRMEDRYIGLDPCGVSVSDFFARRGSPLIHSIFLSSCISLPRPRMFHDLVLRIMTTVSSLKQSKMKRKMMLKGAYKTPYPTDTAILPASE
jgi:hypothetical protein